MLRLTNTQPFAKGNHRACFIHPEADDRCIKVPLPDECGDTRRRKAGWQRLRPEHTYNENLRDLANLSALHTRLGTAAPKHIPRVYGMVETDAGTGLEVELVRNADGKIATSGDKLDFTKTPWESIERALDELLEFCLHHRVLFRDPSPKNLVLQYPENGELCAKIIDGYGKSSFIPIEAWFRSAANRYIRKKHAKLRSRFRRRFDAASRKTNGHSHLTPFL